MAFNIYDPNETNEAMSKLGYDYQLPTTTSIAPSAATGTTAPMAAQPPPPPPPPPATPTNDPGAPSMQEDDAAEKSGPGFGAKAQQVMTGLSQMSSDDKQAKAFQRVGGLIGTIISAYTGNAMGVKSGLDTVKANQG